MRTNIMNILLVILFLVSCQKEEPCDAYQIGTPVEVGFKKTVSFCDESISITFAKVITDSRCPENVACIWQGLAEVEILVNIDGKEKTFQLSTYPSFNNIPSEVFYGDYSFGLEGVFPYPNTNKSYRENDYSIQMLVEKTSE